MSATEVAREVASALTRLVRGDDDVTIAAVSLAGLQLGVGLSAGSRTARGQTPRRPRSDHRRHRGSNGVYVGDHGRQGCLNDLPGVHAIVRRSGKLLLEEGLSVIGRLQCVVLDCPDVLELAQFYESLLGGVVNQPDARWAVGDDFSTLHSGSGLVFGFQRVENYRAPRWPDAAHPQQFHLDLDVPDLDRAHHQVLGLGARLLHVDTRGWRVFADPAGHPFCLLRG